jgi:hypothetical protein
MNLEESRPTVAAVSLVVSDNERLTREANVTRLSRYGLRFHMTGPGAGHLTLIYAVSGGFYRAGGRDLAQSRRSTGGGYGN